MNQKQKQNLQALTGMAVLASAVAVMVGVWYGVGVLGLCLLADAYLGGRR